MSQIPPYASISERVWYVIYRLICLSIYLFLMAPILVIIPLSFNAQDFFTFTPEMLRLDPEGYSLKHYRDFFSNDSWQSAMWNSLKIAPMATIVSVTFGTLAAIGLSQPHVPLRRLVRQVGRDAQNFWAFALATPATSAGYNTPPVFAAHMLLVPAAAQGGGGGQSARKSARKTPRHGGELPYLPRVTLCCAARAIDLGGWVLIFSFDSCPLFGDKDCISG